MENHVRTVQSYKKTPTIQVPAVPDYISPFLSQSATPTGLVVVGRPAGYTSGCLLYSWSTREGTKNAADFPSPVAVQQRMSCPSRIAEMSSSWTACSPFVHFCMSFFTIVLIVVRPTGSCQWVPQAIFVQSQEFKTIQEVMPQKIRGVR